MKICSVDWCGKKYYAKGYCINHYNRFKSHGDPLGGVTSPGGPIKWILDNIGNNVNNCLIWPFCTNNHGYGKIQVDGKLEYVHVIMHTIVNGTKPTQRHEVAHSCGNGHTGCVNPQHLRWATRAENQTDRVKHGTDDRGEKHKLAKLTQDQVLMIFADKNRLHCDIANEYGVSRQLIGRIKSGKIWAWLTGMQDQSST